MSSREIAELTCKRHDHVMRTIDTLSANGVIPFPQAEEKATAGRPSIEYHLDKRSSLILVSEGVVFSNDTRGEPIWRPFAGMAQN